MSENTKPKFEIGNLVEKFGGDYLFSGEVRAVVFKKHPLGAVRYVIEDDRGILHIFSERQLRLSTIDIEE